MADKFKDDEENRLETEEMEEEPATWGEVCRACCVHDAQEWGFIILGLVGVCFFLYFFLVGLDLLGNGAKVIGQCSAGALFGDETNPVAGLMIGILATVLIQSSSSTTSIIVSLVGAGTISVQAGIYMVMGSNIGTSVTNTIVALGHLGDGDELERAFAGATVHDMFNYLSVAVLFPIELITHYLYYISLASVGGGDENRVGEGSSWNGPLKTIVEPLIKKIINVNKSVAKDIASGKKESCAAYYPANCTDGILDATHCTKVGLIKCDKKAGCPAFFQDGATQRDDEISGIVVFFLGLFMLLACLIGLVTILQKMMSHMSTRILHKATNVNGYLAILIGAGLTILVQSSSITTSTLTPFVGMGALQLEQMFPLTLGANIGTTVTGLLAALVTDGTNALQVALCHLYFNITGIIIWYPIPFMRRIPLNLARSLGSLTRMWRGIPVVYIFIVFVAIPALLLGLSSLFTLGSVGYSVLGAFLTIILVLVLAYYSYMWFKGGLKERTLANFAKREKKRSVMESLPEDMDYIKAELERLRDHTGLPESSPEEEK